MRLWTVDNKPQEGDEHTIMLFGRNELPLIDDAPPARDRFFVIGTGRTGTTVFGKMMSQHPDCWCGNECDVVSSLINLLTTTCVQSLTIPGCFGIRVDRREDRNWPEGEEAAWRTSEIREMCEVWCRMEGRRHGASVIGDKGSVYLGIRGMIRRIFPGCTFFMTTRNPLDQMSSYMDQPWNVTIRDDGSEESLRKVHGWLLYRLKMDEVGLEDDVHLVSFEDFGHIDTLRATMESCWERLGLLAPDVDLSGFVRPEPIGRWRSDERVHRILSGFERLGLEIPEGLGA